MEGICEIREEIIKGIEIETPSGLCVECFEPEKAFLCDVACGFGEVGMAEESFEAREWALFKQEAGMLEELPKRIEAIFEEACKTQKRRIHGIFCGELVEPSGERFGGPRGRLRGDGLREADQDFETSAFAEDRTRTQGELKGSKGARGESKES